MLGGCGNADDGARLGQGRSPVLHFAKIPLAPEDGAPGLSIVSTHFDGKTAVVGATTDDATRDGYAYFFDFSDGAFTQKGKLTAGDQYFRNTFGGLVAIDGDYAVVKSGYSAYALARQAGTWTVEQQIVSGTTSFTRIDAVSVSGDTMILGSEDESTGNVRVFRRIGGAWSLEATLVADDPTPTPYFGDTALVHGDTIFVGAPAAFHPVFALGSEPPGAVYVFSRTSSGWQRVQKLIASDASDGDLFGASLSYDGDTLVVGATGADGGAIDNGEIYLFRDTGSGFVEQSRITSFPNGSATNAYRVAVDGDWLATSPYPGVTSSLVELFERNAEEWAPSLEIDETDDSGLAQDLSLASGTVVGGGDTAAHAYAIQADSVCTPDGASANLGNGKLQACAPYTCAAGACLTSCTDSNDCAPGTVCDPGQGQGVCVSGGDRASDDGGCATSPASGSPLWLVGLMSALVLARRRRCGR